MEKFVVHEASMRPALEPGDRLLAWRGNPAPGDVVVFPEPGGGGRWFVKRLVARGGAVVTIRDGILYIETPDAGTTSVRLPIPEPDREWRLAEHEGFVLSDALDTTRADSRVYGPIPTEEMLTVMVRYAPLDRLRWRLNRSTSWDRSAWRDRDG